MSIRARETAEIIVTEYGPDCDWHAAITTKTHLLIWHKTFLEREDADSWVEGQLHIRGTDVMGVVAMATICPFCRRN